MLNDKENTLKNTVRDIEAVKVSVKNMSEEIKVAETILPTVDVEAETVERAIEHDVKKIENNLSDSIDLNERKQMNFVLKD